MLIIKHQQTGKERRVPDSEINDLCTILASTNPHQPTEKEVKRAAVYRDRIMLQGRTIQAAGVRVWHITEPTPTLVEQAEQLFN